MNNIHRGRLEEEIKSMHGEIPMEQLAEGETIFIAQIGSHVGENWEGFIPPSSATITKTSIEFKDLTRFNPAFGFGGGDYHLKTDNNIELSLPIKTELLDEDLEYVKSIVEYNGYKFIDTDFDRLKERVTKELLRIVTGTWAGNNNVKSCDALKQVLRTDPTEFFSKQYPELVI